ncbi:hypothetical protein BMF94_3813 [Rhodotorula taiwanensis]|uniref:Uncharacterized protein n=1 Tax=Rhodotorula taiwanensis TaxID=741276 RepID=A0A2S5B8L3_9BASI|nr:hypothetical protein BMF94_3813 [Rhodotorula taiwanensis]
MNKIIYLTRHAQAYHNVAEDWSIPDAELTPLGRDQSAALRKDTERTFQRHVDLIVSSPLRRPMQTALIGCAPLIERLNGQGKPMILLPELQEVNDLPCDTGSARKDLESNPEFASLDFSPLEPSPLPSHWSSAPTWTSKRGLFDPNRCQERARWVRRWLRDETHPDEKHVVVVAHGDILRVIADGHRSDKPWANAEVRAFRFKAVDDHDAVLVAATEIEITASGPDSASEATVAKEGSDEPTSSELKN